jgi:hypothetical protein
MRTVLAAGRVGLTLRNVASAEVANAKGGLINPPVFGHTPLRVARFLCPAQYSGRQAAFVASSTGSKIEGSSFSGLLTRVDIGHIRINSAGNGRMRSAASGSSPIHGP